MLNVDRSTILVLRLMAVSKYPTLHRLITEVQEVTGAKPIDGFIGKDTERALATALAGYDGNDILGYLADHTHRQVELADEIPDQSHLKTDIPTWLAVARSYIGLEEIVGSEHNEQILAFWKACKLPFRDDETPWCAGFVGGVLEQCRIRSSRSGMARSYLKWGTELTEPKIGAVVVFWRVARYSTSGHVGFVADHPDGGFIPTLGGNQGNKVCIKPYPQSRVLGYRWAS